LKQPPPVATSQPVAGNFGQKALQGLIESIHQRFQRVTDAAGPADKKYLPSGALKAHGAAALQTGNGFAFHAPYLRNIPYVVKGFCRF
jgi:hypothetical protein